MAPSSRAGRGRIECLSAIEVMRTRSGARLCSGPWMDLLRARAR
jgi:hypothetical protein